MAKHAKRTKKKTYRRRKVGAMAFNASSDLVKYGSVAAGFLMAKTINTAIDNAAGTSIDGKLIAAAQVGAGALYLLKKGKKSLPLVIATGVLAGAGVKRALTEFGIGGIGGYQNVPVIGNRRMVAGYGKVPVIGAYNPASSVGAYAAGNPGKIMGAFGGSAVNNGSGSASGLMG